KIGPKDQLEIKVAKSDIFNTLARVTEDGKITINYVGEVVVENLTTSELEKKLAQILIDKRLMLDPQVQVSVKDFQSSLVSVLGAVKEPGMVQLMGRQTLMQVISKAGGITRDAGREIIIIRRQPDGTSNALHIPTEDLFTRGDTKYDVPLEPSDIVNVQVDREVQIYVMGQVKTPGALKVLQSRIPTVTQAIAQAGDFTERARKGHVIIRRKDPNGTEREQIVDVSAILNNKAKDVPLQENDIVFVPQSLF
ncbi:MAG: polysaccharide biosynthesis/export family protein, partial [Candidatus Aminicenantales bacterium]